MCSEDDSLGHGQSARGRRGEDSAGSRLHGTGLCRPCAFFHSKGCTSGANCHFCHQCPHNERERRKRFARQVKSKLLDSKMLPNMTSLSISVRPAAKIQLNNLLEEKNHPSELLRPALPRTESALASSRTSQPICQVSEQLEVSCLATCPWRAPRLPSVYNSVHDSLQVIMPQVWMPSAAVGQWQHCGQAQTVQCVKIVASIISNPQRATRQSSPTGW